MSGNAVGKIRYRYLYKRVSFWLTTTQTVVGRTSRGYGGSSSGERERERKTETERGSSGEMQRKLGKRRVWPLRYTRASSSNFEFSKRNPGSRDPATCTFVVRAEQTTFRGARYPAATRYAPVPEVITLPKLVLPRTMSLIHAHPLTPVVRFWNAGLFEADGNSRSDKQKRVVCEKGKMKIHEHSFVLKKGWPFQRDIVQMGGTWIYDWLIALVRGFRVIV